MEVIGVISRSVLSFSGANGIDAYCQPHNAAAAASSPSPSSFVVVGLRRVCRRTRKFAGFSSCEFRQKDHLDYYSSGGKIMCGGGKMKKCAKKDKKYKATQERLIMLEGLSSDLSMFSSHGFAVVHPPPDYPDNVSLDQDKAMLVSGQLKQPMMEDKELKIRRKVEKMRLRMQAMADCDLSSSSTSSSSSSESSDSDCEDMVDMNAQNVLLEPVTKHESLALARLPLAPSVIQSKANQEQDSTTGIEIRSSVSPEQGCCSRPCNGCGGLADNGSITTNGLVARASPMKIEVCMGGKCKRSGAAALLGEFQRLVGIEGAVSGCKCMGKCRDGPNVRILNDHVKTAMNPLCIGVGLEDVDSIVANFIGESYKLGFAD